MIKYGVSADPSVIDRMRATLPPILAREADALTPLVGSQLPIKAGSSRPMERE